MRFSLYDKVRPKRTGQFLNNNLVKNYIGEIVGIDNSIHSWPYMVEFGQEFNKSIDYFDEDDLELVEKFTGGFLVKLA